ncbi:MAG: phospholipase D-like domain-containing protein, partial [Synergistaceae bacterium]|nr:phospholipase D-like domain-containing protein [Synergistaceae bacterium]
IAPALYSLTTRNPRGTSVEAPSRGAGTVEYLYDLTFEANGAVSHDHHILKKELELINSAQKFILLDMFLFNDAYNKKKESYPNIADRLAAALIAKKREIPDIQIYFITDPYNGFYGSYREKHWDDMEAAGIKTIVTDLDEMRDSNPLYSGFYRLCLKHFNFGGDWRMGNPIDPSTPDITFRALLRLANLKANHRKTLVTDKGAIVASANPHDPSGYNSNVGIFIRNSEIVNDIISSERVVAEFSGASIPPFKYEEQEEDASGMKVRLLTEDKISDGLISNIKMAKMGDAISIGIFYISSLKILSELRGAVGRGVDIRIVADQNVDAFGMKKNGRPNRDLLSKLVRDTGGAVRVRWYITHGEQYHVKMSFFEFKDRDVVILGSGNYTRRNIGGYNMESDIEAVMNKDSSMSRDIKEYFERIWNNRGGLFTADHKSYERDGAASLFLCIFQELTGLCAW